MSEKTREFVKAVRNKDENEIRRTLKETLKEKVINRLKQTTED